MDGIGKAFKHFLSILSIDLIIFGLFIVALFTFCTDLSSFDDEGVTAGINLFIILLVYVFIGGPIVLVIASLFVHVPFYVLSDGNGFGETIKVVAYSATPFVLLGWIPFFILDGIPIFTLIGTVWSLALCIIGIRELHNTTTLGAVGAVIIAVISIPVFILLFLMLIDKLSPISTNRDKKK